MSDRWFEIDLETFGHWLKEVGLEDIVGDAPPKDLEEGVVRLTKGLSAEVEWHVLVGIPCEGIRLGEV